jgi:4a-hydroxytetrahydrobiopterin dehydratase
LSPSPSSNSISVEEGTRLAIRIRPDYASCRGRRPAGVNLSVVEDEDVDRLDDQAIESRLAELEGWEREGDAITKTFKCGDFVGSVEFVQKLVEPAEDMGHHPDLSLSWDEVRVTITTHAAGGLTNSDFELAKRIDALSA